MKRLILVSLLFPLLAYGAPSAYMGLVDSGTGAPVTLDDGTDVAADLEEETHAAEHASGGGDAVDHDTLTNFVLAEHVDWTQDQGATDIHAGNVGAAHIDAITEIAAALKSGADAELITGTIATTNAVVAPNADDDLVDYGLTWNVTAATCTGDGNAGALTVNVSNEIVCSADDGGAGGYTSWTLAGDAGTPQTIADGNTATIAGDGVGIDTSAGATDTLTISYVALDAEAENEGVLDLQDLQGAVTDGQVPNTITIDLATVATTANAGDSATAFFSSGTIEHERGGMEADVSAYAGLVRIDSGSTSNVTDLSGLNTALGGINIVDTGTMTDTKYCTYDSAGAEIDCNSEGGAGGLTISAQTLTVAGLDIEPDTSYQITCSGITGDRYLDVKDGTAGDEAEIVLLTGCDTATDAYELVVRGDSTDSVTFSGVAAGTEWSRLFIAREALRLRWRTATAVEITSDRRIAQKGYMGLTTAIATSTAAAWNATNFDTEIIDVGGVVDVGGSTSYITVRRAGDYFISVVGQPNSALAADEQFRTCATVNGNVGTGDIPALGTAVATINLTKPRASAPMPFHLGAGDTVQHNFYNASTSNAGLLGSGATIPYVSGLSVVEQF